MPGPRFSSLNENGPGWWFCRSAGWQVGRLVGREVGKLAATFTPPIVIELLSQGHSHWATVTGPRDKPTLIGPVSQGYSCEATGLSGAVWPA